MKKRSLALIFSTILSQVSQDPNWMMPGTTYYRVIVPPLSKLNYKSELISFDL